MMSEYGVSGPAGVDILREPGCGNFSGLWWDGQVAAVATLWTAFLRGFTAAGGRVDEVVLDTERSLTLEFLWLQPNKSASAPDCARLRLRSIQRDTRFAPVRAELLFNGMKLGDASDPGPDSLWLAVRHVSSRSGCHCS